VIEAQSRFAALLLTNGIETPKAYTSDGNFTRTYSINGYDVVVTVEDFKDGEIRTVDPQTAEDTGKLLARMHNTAEANDCHVDCEVLFDPLAPNDLFFYESFVKRKERLLEIDRDLYNSIVKKHDELISRIAPLGRKMRYAVQGDISDCNLYRTEDGRIGVFDFNRCGDNSLFFDAVMQAVFESRLMDYPEELDGHQEEIIFSSFLEGYQHVRPFTAEQKQAFPYLYALITAFWGVDMKWADNSRTKTVDEADDVSVRQWMKDILERESTMCEVPG
jgi:Ser/Thr protein kinase RdoA (MazF antagonist)